MVREHDPLGRCFFWSVKFLGDLPYASVRVVYRVFRWSGLFPTHDWDFWNRSSGKKVLLGFGEWDPCWKTWENVKTMRREKCPFSNLFGVHG